LPAHNSQLPIIVTSDSMTNNGRRRACCCCCCCCVPLTVSKRTAFVVLAAAAGCFLIALNGSEQGLLFLPGSAMMSWGIRGNSSDSNVRRRRREQAHRTAGTLAATARENKIVAASNVESSETTTTKATTEAGPSNKPTFYLHVGLHKTGTAFLQSSLCEHAEKTEPIFLSDNLVYLGTCSDERVIHRQRQKPDMDKFLVHSSSSIYQHRLQTKVPGYVYLAEHASYPEDRPAFQYSFNDHFLRRVQELRPSGHNVLMVYETASYFSPNMILQLKELLSATWDVKILVVHRTFHDWLLSFDIQASKVMEGQGWNKQVVPFDLNDPETLSAGGRLFHAVEQSEIHPAQQVQQLYQTHFDRVELAPLNEMVQFQSPSSQADPLLEYVLCQFVDTAQNSCAAVRSGDISASEYRHEHHERAYDLIVQEAYQRQMLNHSVDRIALASRLKQHLEQENIHLPMVCPSSETLERLERVSARVDGKLLEWTKDRQVAHRDNFQQMVAKQRFCDVDVENVLRQGEKWISFFQQAVEETPREA